MSHEHIIKYYESFIRRDKICIIMEFASGGDIKSVTKDKLTKNEYLSEDIVKIAIYVGLEVVYRSD